MNYPDEKERELQRRQKEIEEREHALRLRELEAELYEQHKEKEPPLYQTIKDDPSKRSLNRLGKKLLNVAKFLGFVVVTIALVRIAHVLALAVMVAGIVWLGYTIFLAKE